MAGDDVTKIAHRGDPGHSRVSVGTIVRPGGPLPDFDGGDDYRHPSSVDIGSVVRGRFELELKIGEGGMGVVYRAIDRLHREMQDREPYVAIKILNSNLKRHPSALIALQRETRKAQLLAHENIINVHSFDRDGSIVYMTMELLDGQSLRTLVAANPSGLPAADVVPMIRSMAKALAYAHDNEIVHADFKPSNVFLTRKKQIKVLDFGLARANPIAPSPEDGSVLEPPALSGMTPAYASPEMLAGNEPTPSDDVFALAIVSFELLTGRHPFDFEPADAARLTTLQATTLPKLSRPQRKALRRALRAEAASRHGNAGEFLRDFEGPSKIKRTAQASVAAAVALPLVAFLFSGQGGGPAVPFESLAPEVRAQFERAVAEGETALSFGSAGINDALLFFSSAFELHPNNPRAVRGLETVADRFLASLTDSDVSARSEVFGLLYCNDYLSRYRPVTSSCGDLLSTTQCAAIAARCEAPTAGRAR